MKGTTHKPDDCNISKKQQTNNEGINFQNNTQHSMTNQATYAKLLPSQSFALMMNDGAPQHG